MRYRTISHIILGVFLLLSFSGCNLQKTDDISPSDQKYTEAAQTVAVELTSIASNKTQAGQEPSATQAQKTSESTPSPEPDETELEPTKEPTKAPENTSEPTVASTPTTTSCNQALFIIDVNYEDGEVVPPNTEFEKTWRLQNTGSCAWDTNYLLVFNSGDRLGAADSKQLHTESVASGQIVDISIKLKSPEEPGTYQAFFMIKAPDGEIFGIGENHNGAFYVKIVVPKPGKTPTPTSDPKADLQITDFTLDPGTPIQGQAVQVSVTVMNKGNLAAGAFVVQWYPEENSSTPACVWDVISADPNGGQVLTCDYTGYTNSYESINTKVIADANNSVPESDETNNTVLKPITVNAAP